jgi:RNA polymerase sigma factor (sigma-70 family)
LLPLWVAKTPDLFVAKFRGEGRRGDCNGIMSVASMRFSAQELADSPIDWGKAWEEHRRWLATVIRSRLADREAAEDVLQEVAVAAIGQRSRPTDPAKVAPWLYRVALRQVVNHHRATGRHRRLHNGVAQSGQIRNTARDPEPGEWLMQQEATMSLSEGLSRVEPLDRQLLLLKYTEGWGYQQLSEYLGISMKTVEYRLLKARRALRAAVQDPS